MPDVNIQAIAQRIATAPGSRFRVFSANGPGSFGDECVDLTDDEIELRLGRERGQIYVEIRPSGSEHWFHDFYIGKFFDVQLEFGDQRDTEATAKLLADSLRDAMVDKREFEDFTEFEARERNQRSSEIFPE